MGFPVERSRLAQLLGSVSARSPAPPTPSELLVELASRVGVDARGSQLSIHDVQQLADPQAPLLALGRSDGGGERWVLVTERQGKRLAGAVIDGGRVRQRVLQPAELVALLHLQSERVPSTWISLESALPLEALGAGSPGAAKKPSPLARLRAALKLERETLWALGVYAAFAGLLALATPLTVQALVNTIAFGGLLQPLLVLTLLLLGSLVFAGGLRVLQSVVVELLQRRVFVRAVVDLAGRLPRVSYGVHEKAYAPELVNRFFEVVTLQKAAATLLLDGLELSLAVVIGIVILSLYHPVLLGFSAVLVVALIVVLFVGGRGTIASSIEESNAKYAIAAWLEEVARLPLTFRSRRDAVSASERADDLARVYLRARGGHFRRVLRQIIGLIGLQVLFSAALLALGGWLVLEGQLTLGQLVAAELIVTLVVASLAKFGKQLETFYDLAAALDKLGKLIDLPLERASRTMSLAFDSGAPVVQIDGVQLGGVGAIERPLSLLVGRGERLGIAGRSGCGKSQLLDAIYGLRAVHSGRVLVDGVDLDTVDLSRLREGVVLLRKGEIIATTIRENLRLQRPDRSDEAIETALARVGLLELVRRFPDGLDTTLGAAGAPLSAGQRVRLAVAGALLRAPRLLLIDGLLDGLDRQSRAELADLILSPEAPWTLLIVSHHDDLLRRCDRVFRLDQAGDAQLEQLA